MTGKHLIRAALVLAAAGSAALLGACKAADTAGGGGASQAALKTAEPGKSAPATGTTVVAADGVRRVTVAELQKMAEGGGVVIYDTRAKASYDQEHIKGALSLPHDEAAARAGEVPKDKTLVFYCT